MKFAAENIAEQEQWLKPVEFTLPAGIIGFPAARRIELLVNPDELPFMWLRCTDNHSLNFIAVEPYNLIQGYTIELSDDDASRLEIANPEDVFILNIVTFKSDDPEAATVNLIGPIVINRRTLVGRQVVITNFADYSARHRLLAQTSAGVAQF